MPIGQPAYRRYDNVKIVDAEKLRFLYERSTTSGSLSIHHILDPELHLQADKETRIVEVSCYHMDIPLYHIEGSDFPWLEEAFVDRDLIEDCPANDPRSRADRTYIATLTEGQLGIFNHAAECFCRLRKRYSKDAVDAANLVARIRNRAAFETIYGFDGRYSGDEPN